MAKPAIFDMNLQLFAEGTPPEPEPQDDKQDFDFSALDKPITWDDLLGEPDDEQKTTADDEPANDQEPDDGDKGDDSEPDQSDFAFEIVYNGEKIVIKDESELRTLAQKGMNYDKIYSKLKEAEQQLAERDEWVKRVYGDKGIDSWDKFQQSMKEEQKQKVDEHLENLGLSREELRELIKNDPEFREVYEKARLYEEVSKQSAVESVLQKQIDEFNREYGMELKTPEDIISLDNAEKIIDYMQKGIDLKDAYFLVNRDKILEEKMAAAKQRALNNVNNKKHIKPNGGTADSEPVIDIPPETYRMYKELLGWSDKKIREHYRKEKLKEANS